MIADVDRFITRLLIEEGVVKSEKQIIFDAPSQEPPLEPVINCYLHDIRENLERRQYGRVVRKDTEKKMATVDFRPMWFDLQYAISTGGKNPAERHQLLADTLQALIKHHVIAPPIMDKPLAGETSLNTQVAEPEDLQDSFSFWQSARAVIRPFIRYVVTAPMMPRPQQATPLVRERVIRVYDEFFQAIMMEDHYRVSIAGYVKDSNSKPIQGATIIVKDARPIQGEDTRMPSMKDEMRTASTDSSGFFYVTGLPEGKYLVQLDAFQYSQEIREVVVPANNYAECNTTMSLNKGPLTARESALKEISKK